MAAISNATPLIALDAVVIDTETTGLDPAKARIVEIAAVRLVGGRLDAGRAVPRAWCSPASRSRQRPPRIHGIDDAAVAGRAALRARSGRSSRGFSATRCVIGHSLGFDLAVLKRECERAGVAWTRRARSTRGCSPRSPSPNLAGYSLEAARRLARRRGRPGAIPRSATR